MSAGEGGEPGHHGSEGEGRSRVRVRIAGEEHAIRSAADPEHTRRCAALVDERIRDIQERSGLLEGHRAAILAALSIADQYLRAADDLKGTEEEMTARVEALVRRVDAGLTGRSPSEPGHEGPSAPTEGEGP